MALGAGDLADAFPVNAGQDLLGVFSQNLGENKIDIFLQRTLEYEAEVDPDTGEVTSRLVVTLTNNAPCGRSVRSPSSATTIRDCPRVRIVCGCTSTHRSSLTAARLDGVEVPMVAEEELGWFRYRRDLWLDPGQTEILELDLAGVVDVTNGYFLAIEHQPMVNPDDVKLRITSKDTEKLQQAFGIDRSGQATVVLAADALVGFRSD